MLCPDRLTAALRFKSGCGPGTLILQEAPGWMQYRHHKCQKELDPNSSYGFLNHFLKIIFIRQSLQKIICIYWLHKTLITVCRKALLTLTEKWLNKNWLCCREAKLFCDQWWAEAVLFLISCLCYKSGSVYCMLRQTCKWEFVWACNKPSGVEAFALPEIALSLLLTVCPPPQQKWRLEEQQQSLLLFSYISRSCLMQQTSVGIKQISINWRFRLTSQLGTWHWKQVPLAGQESMKDVCNDVSLTHKHSQALQWSDWRCQAVNVWPEPSSLLIIEPDCLPACLSACRHPNGVLIHQ